MSWQKVKEILDAALDVPQGERPAYLEEACAGDEALLLEVQALLSVEATLGDFLEEPIFSLRGDTGDAGDDPNLGKVVGSYRLLRRLGDGGMGAVYLAERADEEFEQRVAVKLIKRGMDTDEIVRRFRAERQILANLDHPNIAKLLDGGTTEDGLPYFVMEHVEGEPLLDHCDAQHLSITQRLKLFRTVCSAVQFAHQNLVVHRDLKPGNILITPDGTPKLLDFGIAKLLGPESSGQTYATVPGTFPLTPGYASPEQVTGDPVTTASDVYSLGVLLYELLTGHRPYHADTLRPEEWPRLICETDPPRPSTAVARREEVELPTGETREVTPEGVARARGEEPARLRRRLAGDLDNVVQVAMAKERDRRYGTAGELADDLRRHLEGMPVRARGDSFGYRAGKFTRRHAWGLGVAAAAVLALIAFAVAMAVERDRTAAQRDRAEAATEFLVQVFEKNRPEEAQGEDLTVRQALDRSVPSIDADLAETPLIQATLKDAIGQIYRSLGLNEEAETVLRSAVELRRRYLGPDHPLTAASEQNLALVLRELREIREAEALLRSSLAVLRRHLPADDLDLAHGLHNLGALLVEEKREYAEGEELLLEALAIKRKQLGPKDTDLADLAITLNSLGVAHLEQGDPERAEEYLREALTIRQEAFEGAHPQIATTMDNLAVVLGDQGKRGEAESLFEAEFEMLQQLYDGSDPRLIRPLNNRASALEDWGEPEAAESLCREALAILTTAEKPSPKYVAVVRTNLASALAGQGRFDACEEEAQAAVTVYVDHHRLDDWRAAHAKTVLGSCFTGQGRFKEAESLLMDGYGALVEKEVERSYIEDARQRLVALYEAWGKPEEAARYRAGAASHGGEAADGLPGATPPANSPPDPTPVAPAPESGSTR